MDNIRLNKVSRLVQKEVNTYFQQNATTDYLRSMISATRVRVTADLSFAHIYLSIFPTNKQEEVFDLIKSNKLKIKYEIGKIIGKQLRKVPDFDFHIDDSIDYAERINDLLKD